MSDWTEDHVAAWLDEKVVFPVADTFRRAHVDGKMLLRGVTERELDDMGVASAVVRLKIASETAVLVRAHIGAATRMHSPASNLAAEATRPASRGPTDDLPADVATWSVVHVRQFLDRSGMPPAVVSAFLDNGVTGELLVEGLSTDDLAEMGVTGVKQRAVLAVIARLASRRSE